MIKLKEYIVESLRKRILLENKPLSLRNFLSTMSNISSESQKLIRDNYANLRPYTRFISKSVNSNTESVLPNLVKLCLRHKDRCWSYLNYKEKDNIVLGNVLESTIKNQLNLCLSNKLLKAEMHREIINDKSHGEIIYEDDTWVYVYPKTSIGSIAWATSYSDGSKEMLRYDLKDKVSWCTSAIGEKSNHFNEITSTGTLLLYCIKKDYKHKDRYRKIALGYYMWDIANEEPAIIFDENITQDANNIELEEEVVNKLIPKTSIEVLDKKLIEIYEKSSFNTESDENEDKSLEQNIESEIKSAISTAEDEEDKSNTISSIFYYYLSNYYNPEVIKVYFNTYEDHMTEDDIEDLKEEFYEELST
tara:strand:- start:5762 stop:6847 length:1086 start_codon:yes stop_codon:yes gene_type:complete